MTPAGRCTRSACGIGGADVDAGAAAGPAALGAATVWCVAGDDLRAVRDSVPGVTRSSRVEVVYWAGERDPDTRAPQVDEIWAPTRFVAERLVPPPGIPVVLAPPLVDRRPACSALTRAELGLPADAVVLLARVDLLDSLARQNPDGVLDAYLRAFPTPGRAFLLLSTRHGSLRPASLDRLAWRVHDRPDIAVRDSRLGIEDDHALTASADVLVSLHRAVAVGTDLVDAMALGRATVATAWSATSTSAPTARRAWSLPSSSRSPTTRGSTRPGGSGPSPTCRRSRRTRRAGGRRGAPFRARGGRPEPGRRAGRPGGVRPVRR